MKLIFAGTSYYASGGANDLYHHKESDTEKVKETARSLIGKPIKCPNGECLIDEDDECFCNGEIEWVQVYCTNAGEIIYSKGEPHGSGDGLVNNEI